MTPPGPGRPPSRRRLRLSDDYPSPGARRDRDSLADCTVKVRGAEDRDSHVGEFFTARVLKQLEHPKLVNMKFLNNSFCKLPTCMLKSGTCMFA